MPPREAPRGQKRAASAAWLVWWPASDKRATAKARRRLIENAPSKRGCAVSVVHKGRNSCVLHFDAPRKYDAVLAWLTRAAECQSDFVRIVRNPEDVVKVPDDAEKAADDVVKEPDDKGEAGPEDAAAASEDAGTQGAKAKELPEPTRIQTAPAGQIAGEDQHEGAASQPSALILALKLAYSRHEAPEVIADLKLGGVLGEGNYSTVHRSSCGRKAVKIYKCTRAAAREVAAYAAVPVHDNIVRLLDVGAAPDQTEFAAFEFHDSPLSALTQAEAPPLQREEVRHIAAAVLRGLGHMHRHGVLHCDVKPANILVSGRGLQGDCDFADLASCAAFAAQLRQLQELRRVVVADLGLATPAGVPQRGPPAAAGSIVVGTLWYRPPEIALGDVRFGEGVDAWGCGCVFAELVCRAPLFWANAEYPLLVRIFRQLGSPRRDSFLAKLPLWLGSFPNFEPTPWPRALVEHDDPELLPTVAGLLTTEPPARWSCAVAAASAYFQARRLKVLLAATEAERGPLSLVQGQLDPRTLRWLQEGPHWRSLPEKIGRKQGREPFGAEERKYKHEEAGFTGDTPPSTRWCNKLDCSKPSPARRVAAFVRAFCLANRRWLDKLTEKIRSRLAQFPPSILQENGRQFMERPLAEDAWSYAVIQVMKPGKRDDPAHFDGAASLLHAGLTVWGRRGLEIRPLPTDQWGNFPQEPGSFYVCNLCAGWHKVAHLPTEGAGPLFHATPAATNEGVHVTVMLRSNVFPSARARTSFGKASPEEVYDAVNALVAQHLAEEGLELLAFEACLAACGSFPPLAP